MKIREGKLSQDRKQLHLGNAVPGDVVEIHDSGNPYLVVDPQNYVLSVGRSVGYQVVSKDNHVIVVSLQDARLRNLVDTTLIKYIKAEVHTE